MSLLAIMCCSAGVATAAEYVRGIIGRGGGIAGNDDMDRLLITLGEITSSTTGGPCRNNKRGRSLFHPFLVTSSSFLTIGVSGTLEMIVELSPITSDRGRCM